MSIKDITITNFLSYASQSVTLGPQLNIFVGKNGSGKSNFFNGMNIIVYYFKINLFQSIVVLIGFEILIQK